MGAKILRQRIYRDSYIAKIKEYTKGFVAIGLIFIPMGIEGAMTLGQVSMLVGTIRLCVVMVGLIVLGLWSGLFL